jgi:putative transposase
VRLSQAAEQTWRRQPGFDYLAKVITGVPFKDGIELDATDRITD